MTRKKQRRNPSGRKRRNRAGPNTPPRHTGWSAAGETPEPEPAHDHPAEPAPPPPPTPLDGPEEPGLPHPGTARTPAESFDLLHVQHARALTRQAFLLSGHRRIAHRAVTHGFHTAWEHWPEVARDPDPVGWVRAAVHDYALSPWHQLRPGLRRPEAYPGPPADRELLDAFLSLPRSYRRTLLLHDGLGLGLGNAAAETQASTAAAAGRLRHARLALSSRVTELRVTPPDTRRQQLAHRLRELAAAQPIRPASPALVRSGSENMTRRRTRGAFALATVVTCATAFTTAAVPDPGAGRGPEPQRAFAPFGAGRQPLPDPDPPLAMESSYLPQLRSVNARNQLADHAQEYEELPLSRQEASER